MQVTVQRSTLAVPATSTHMFEKAAASNADAVFLDLEDAVPPARKEAARSLAISALDSIQWGSKRLMVRVNEVCSPWCYRDIIDVAGNASRIDGLLIPKVAGRDDIVFVDKLLNGLEAWVERTEPIGIDILIETPSGLQNVEAIASASQRIRSLAFGVGDYTVAMRSPQTSFGKPDPGYSVLTAPDDSGARRNHWNDQWHYALARIANACRANGLRPIDGPFTAIDDIEGFRASASRARALGFEGKWVIHPTQIEPANAIFSPTAAELAWAEKVQAAMETAIAKGEGAIRLDGHLVDLAHVRMAQDLRVRDRAIHDRSGAHPKRRV